MAGQERQEEGSAAEERRQLNRLAVSATAHCLMLTGIAGVAILRVRAH